MGAGRRAAVRKAARSASEALAEPGDAHRTDPRFHRAILKIALGLKRPGAGSYDAIVEQTIRSMRLDAAAFRRYLGGNGARNMSLLLATARAPGL